MFELGIILKRKNVLTGTVKWFNAEKGYGFIVPDKGGDDVIVHIAALEKAGLKNLNEGSKVSYEVKETSVENLQIATANKETVTQA